MQEQKCYTIANSVIAKSLPVGGQDDSELISNLAAWAKLTPTGVARQAGLAVTTMTRPIKGDVNYKLSRRTLEKLEAAFPAYPGWDKGEEPARVSGAAVSNDHDTVELVKLDLSLSMGPGTLIDDWVEETSYRFDPSLLRVITRSPAHRLRLVTGVGDSMYPTLTHGDHIVVDTTERQLARQDGIYWINLHGAAGLKRLRAVGKGKVLVKSDNPQVGDQEVDAEDLRIDGRAVWVMRGL